MHYLTLALIVFGINLFPAFAPGTWTILVFYKINSNLNSIAIIVIGVLAASLGRYLLAHASRALRFKLNEKYVANLSAAKKLLTKNKKISFIYIFFFIFTPLPSAQIFEAAGLTDAPLIPLTLAFMLGRSVGYSLSVIGASTLKEHALGSIFTNAFKSPWGISLQIICLLAIYLLARVDWSRYLHKGPTTS